jgi:hypothetical protein
MPIYESPDGGQTVYVRDEGTVDRSLHVESEKKRSLRDDIQESQLWGNIRRRAKTHPGLQDELDRVIMFYLLLEQNVR